MLGRPGSHLGGLRSGSCRGPIPRQYVHHRRARGRSRGNGAGRGLRLRLVLSGPGRRCVWPAVRRVRGASRQRVQDQRLHDGSPAPSRHCGRQRRRLRRDLAGRLARDDPGSTLRSLGRRHRRRIPGQYPYPPGERLHAAERREVVRRPIRRRLDDALRRRSFRSRRPPVRHGGHPHRQRVRGEHLHDRLPSRGHRRHGGGRRLRSRLVGSVGLLRQRLRPALRRLGQPAGGRVPGEHLHQCPTVPSRGRWIPGWRLRGGLAR